jgi:hypothetical protein
MATDGFLGLLGRYLGFLWMFESVAAGASMPERAAVVRRNRERGLRYLPIYLRRYVWLIGQSTALAIVAEMLSAPLICAAFLTGATIAAVALVIAAVGLLGMRLRLGDHARF